MNTKKIQLLNQIILNTLKDNSIESAVRWLRAQRVREYFTHNQFNQFNRRK